MTELEKIAYAKSFIDKLANGINPIDGTPIPDGDIVNNVRLSRCFFYVSSLLQSEIDRERKKEKKAKKEQLLDLSITYEQLEGFEYSSRPISVTVLSKKINQLVQGENMKKLSYRQIVGWLLHIGLLEYVDVGNGKMKCNPTAAGEEVGIILEFWEKGYGRKVPVIKYSEKAQRFIVDNIEAVIAFGNATYEEKTHLDNKGKRWDAEQDERMVALFNEGASVREISRELKRSENAIGIRLQNKGINLDTVTAAKEQPPMSCMNEETDEITGAVKEEITCQSCRFARNGECFPQKEICADYERVYAVPKEERAAWPEMGDASYLRQNGRRR